MEALAAIGLAGTIVQFVDFSLQIYGKTREIISSARGATQFNLELEQYCLRLEDFNSKLSPIESSINQHSTGFSAAQDDVARRHGDTIREHVDGVKKVAYECSIVCNRLLDVLQSLRHDKSGRLRVLKALAQALKEQFNSKQIAQLEGKLKDFQIPLQLHLTSLLNERQIYMTRLLESVASGHEHIQLRQTKRFHSLRSRFDTMAEDIRALTRKLAATPAHHSHGELEGLERMLGDLRLSEEDIGKAATEQKVIQSLSFPEKTARHENITEAHQRTFEWVLQGRDESLSVGQHDTEPTELPQRGDFVRWLRNDNGIFWITGKPGSGKSTLMKFIAGHDKTRHALKSWAGEKDVVVASHYFWAIGTEKQKSQRGLLQKMVFDVLSQCPQLAWDIFPDRCKQDCTTSTAASFSLPHGEAWPLAELRKALLRLSEVTSVPAKFCFFIDGLDEYSEDHIGLCETVKGFAKSENVKCCVSSRSWNEFENAFGGNQSALLRVHELTQNDIRTFARDRLASIPGSKDSSVDDSSTRDLADIIAKRAEGVFLWVFLVTQEMRNGIANGSTMKELSALLVSLPSELEDYFKHMIESVPKQHHRYMAKTLQIALAGKKTHKLDVYLAYEFKDDNADFAWSMPINRDSEIFYRHSQDKEVCKLRINDRCKGLLSFSRNNDVDFIHRTVHSYLMTRPMQDYLKSRTEAVFHPMLATLESLVFLFRHCVTDLCSLENRSLVDHYMKGARQKWDGCLLYLDEAMAEDKEATFRLIDKIANLQFQAEPGTASDLRKRLLMATNRGVIFIKSTATLGFTAPYTVSDTGGNNGNVVKLFLNCVSLRPGCQSYAMARLRDNQDHFRADGISALGTMLVFNDASEKLYSSVTELLEMGFDPNELLKDGEKGHTTPWEIFLEGEIYSISIDTTFYFDIALALLKHGADKSSLVRKHHGRDSCLMPRLLRNIIRGIFEDPTPKLLKDLLAALFDTPSQTKTLLLEEFACLALPDSGHRTLNRAMTEIIEMISIEMINVSLDEKAFWSWLSMWRGIPGAVSPHLEAMAEDYLSVGRKRRNDDENNEASSQRPKRRTKAELWY